MAEVHGNRTHRPTLRGTTGFEVQEAHQDLSTSDIINARNGLKSQYHNDAGFRGQDLDFKKRKSE